MSALFYCSFCGHEWTGYGPTHLQGDPGCPECGEEDSWQEELDKAVAGLLAIPRTGMSRTSMELHVTAALWGRWPRELCRGVLDAILVTESSVDCDMLEDGRYYEHGWKAVERMDGR